MGSTHRHRCNDKRSIKRTLHTHTNQTTKTTFIISDVNCAILGLDTITKNKLHLRVKGYRGHLARDHAEVQLKYTGNHFYLKATIFDGLHDYVDYTPDFTDWYYSWYEVYDNDNKVYGLLQEDAEQADYVICDTPQQEAQAPKTDKSLTLPTQQEIEEHNITHLPYRDWCKHFVQGKSRSQHHQRGGLTKQSITQIDYAYIKRDNESL
eukprot:4949954-Amphidinium_carterae.2